MPTPHAQAQARYRARKQGYAEMNARHQRDHVSRNPEKKASRNLARKVSRSYTKCPSCGAGISGSNKVEVHHDSYAGESSKTRVVCRSCHPNRGRKT